MTPAPNDGAQPIPNLWTIRAVLLWIRWLAALMMPVANNAIEKRLFLHCRGCLCRAVLLYRQKPLSHTALGNVGCRLATLMPVAEDGAAQ